jgi:hypothetical protein
MSNPEEPTAPSEIGITVTVTPGCDHADYISSSVARWWGRQYVRICLKCFTIFNPKTGKPV